MDLYVRYWLFGHGAMSDLSPLCAPKQTVFYYSLTSSEGLAESKWMSQQAVKFSLANRVALACAFFEAGSI
jgi:hypothetical protein